MKYTQVPADTFENIQLNAGVLLSEFDPSSATVDRSKIIAATSGGVQFTATPSFSDFGEDIDNMPTNTKELKKLDSWEAKLSGTAVTVNAEFAKTLLAAADNTNGHVTPRVDLAQTDFEDLWWVGDYSDVNEDGTGSTAGFIAIKVINSLSTGGFSLQSANKGKGQFSFEFTGHYSISNTDLVPFDIYVMQGE